MDFQLQLANPFRSGGQPAVPCHPIVDDDGEATAASGESGSHEIGFAAHRGFDELRPRGANLLDRKCRLKPLSPMGRGVWRT